MSNNILEVLKVKFGHEITNTAVIEGQIINSNLFNNKELLAKSANKQIENYIAEGIIGCDSSLMYISRYYVC